MSPHFDAVQQRLHDLTFRTQAELPAHASASLRWKAAVASGVPDLFVGSNGARSRLGLVEICVVSRAAALGGDADNVWDRFLSRAEGDEEARNVARRLCTAPDTSWPPSNGVPVQADSRTLLRRGAGLLGLSERAGRLSVERAQQRVIGDRSLLGHQAAAHRLARSWLELKRGEMSIWEAAWRHENDGEDGTVDWGLVAWAEVTAGALGMARTLAQIFGAAGTSDPTVASIYARIHRDAATFGPPARLWERASRASDRSAGSLP